MATCKRCDQPCHDDQTVCLHCAEFYGAKNKVMKLEYELIALRRVAEAARKYRDAQHEFVMSHLEDEGFSDARKRVREQVAELDAALQSLPQGKGDENVAGNY